MKTVVTKGEFARLKGRSPAAVSNWIKDGRLTAAALIGTGNRARIWVEQADADLARSLDPVQQDRLAQPVATTAAAAERDESDDIARRRKADADRAESEAELARRKLALDEGRWIDAAEARRAWGRELSTIVTETETFMTNTLAHRLADAHGLDWKEVSSEIRRAWRAFRTGTADEAAARQLEAAE